MGMISKQELAKDLINCRFRYSADQHSFQRLYPFCNENVSGYLDILDLEGKSLLTVGSSADQTISAIARGCKDITVLDICRFAEEYFYLKKAAIETLTPKEFGQLFFYKDYPRTFIYNRKPFALAKYPKLLERLKQERPDIHEFWLKLAGTHSGEMIRRNLFTNDEEKPLVTKQLTDYLKSEEAYYQTREKLKGVTPTFINANITHPYVISSSYDNIVLSNLTTYLSYEEIEALFHTLESHLNEDGKLMLGYLYRTDETSGYCEEWDHIYNIPRIKSIHPDITLQTIQGVKGVLFESEEMKDAVYIYQKKK